MPKSIMCIVMICLAYAVLAGCGTKGPLYIPEQRYPQKDSAPEANTGAPSQPTPQTPVKE
jgi:predicted small lipoprotein YifL